MSATRINVGGKEFVASRSTWAKSPVLDMILRRSTEPVPFVDRNPAVFGHILDWLREGKLYINCPSDDTYERLCADADFYGLEDLSRFLANRINLCRFIYFEHDGCRTRCNLDAFRALEPADGFIDRLLAGDRDTLARITFIRPNTVLVNIDFSVCSLVALQPQIPFKERQMRKYEVVGEILGSRFVKRPLYGDFHVYRPVLRTECSS